MSLAGAFPFDPRAFWGDEKVRLMSERAVCAYLRLLSHQWEEGSVPSDPRRMAAILSEGSRRVSAEDLLGSSQATLKPPLSHPQATLEPGWTEGLWGEISGCFELDEETGRLTNPRLRREREEWSEKKRRWAEAGARGGRKSRKRPLQSHPQATLKPPSSPSTSTSTSTSTSEESPSGDSRASLSERWELIWQEFPRKKSKGDGRKAWDAARKKPGYPGDGALVDAIRLAERLVWSKGDRQFTPYPGTWIRAEGWNDEPETPPAPADSREVNWPGEEAVEIPDWGEPAEVRHA